MKLYSYVVDHDNGFAPNPYYGVCTLAHCKYSKGDKRNVVELAKVGDWVVGTGGNSRKSAGNGKLVYAMQVTNKITLKQYYKDPRFEEKKPREGSYQKVKGDNLAKYKYMTKRFVLISKHYFYFGDKAPQIPKPFRLDPDHPLEKKGPGFRSKFSPAFVKAFIKWLQRNYETGMIGKPHGFALSRSSQRTLRAPMANLARQGNSLLKKHGQSVESYQFECCRRAGGKPTPTPAKLTHSLWLMKSR